MTDHGKHNGKSNGHDKVPSEENENIISFSASLAERDRLRREQEKLINQTYRGGHEPMFNLPPMTKYFVGLLIAIHVILVLIDPVWQYWATENFGFVPARYTGDAPFTWAAFAGPFTFMFLHGGWFHLGINSVMLIALGAGLEKWMGGKKMLVLFVLCSLFSVLVHFVFNLHSLAPVVGASGGISGLFAAALIMLQKRGGIPTGRYGLWPLVLLWVVISVMFGVLGSPDGSSVAWAAHVGGFLAGFIFLNPVLKSRFLR